MFKSKRKLSKSSDSESELDHSDLSDEEIGTKTNRSSLKGLTKKSRLLESDGSDSDFVSPQKKHSLKKNNTLLQNDHSESDEEIVPERNSFSKGLAKKSRYLESDGSDSDNVSPKKKDSPEKSSTLLQNDHSDEEIGPESNRSPLKGLAKKLKNLESDGRDLDNVSPKKDSPEKSSTLLQNDDEEIGPESNRSPLKGLAKKSRNLESDASDSDIVSSQKEYSPKKSKTLLQNKHAVTSDENLTNDTISSDNSVDKPLPVKDKKSTVKHSKVTKQKRKPKSDVSHVSSDEEDKPNSNLDQTKKTSKLESDASDSDIVSPQKEDSPKKSNTCLQKEHAVSSDEENLTNDTISSDNSVDKPLPVKAKKSTVKHSKVTKQKRKPKSDASHVSSDEEDKPNSNLGQTKKTSKLESDASDSDIVSPQKEDSPKKSNTCLQTEHAVSSDEENLTNDTISSDNSGDKPLPVKDKKSTVKHSKVTKQKRKPKSDASHVSSDEEDEPNSNLSQTKKISKKSFDRIEHLKKYVRAAGIRINSYDKLFENCKSVKSKVGKLLGLLAEFGLKGRPSIKKCQKLRKKIETKNEIAELDKSNIISSTGRSKRVKNAPLTTSKIENSPRKFSRLRGIIDSEEDSN